MDKAKLQFIIDTLQEVLEYEECFKTEVGEVSCLHCNIDKALDFAQEEVDNG